MANSTVTSINPKISSCAYNLVSHASLEKDLTFNHDTWILDTGATNHIACNLKYFTSYRQVY